MIAIVQRVTEARVKVADTVVGEIATGGLLALVSIVREDEAKDIEWMAAKLTSPNTVSLKLPPRMRRATTSRSRDFVSLAAAAHT